MENGQRLCVCSSTKRKTVLDGWKSSSWEITINPIEVNQQLVKENLEKENQLKKEEQKQKEIQAQLIVTKTKLKEIENENNRLLKSNKRLSSVVVT